MVRDRASTASSADRPGGRITCLIATWRSSISSWASQTLPMPPAPSCRSSRYRPATTVGVFDMPMPQRCRSCPDRVHHGVVYIRSLPTVERAATGDEPQLRIGCRAVDPGGGERVLRVPPDFHDTERDPALVPEHFYYVTRVQAVHKGEDSRAGGGVDVAGDHGRADLSRYRPLGEPAGVRVLLRHLERAGRVEVQHLQRGVHVDGRDAQPGRRVTGTAVGGWRGDEAGGTATSLDLRHGPGQGRGRGHRVAPDEGEDRDGRTDEQRPPHRAAGRPDPEIAAAPTGRASA